MAIEMNQKTGFNWQPIHQYVPVIFHYDVHFTSGIFQLDNPLLAQVIAADGETTPKKVVAVVDTGLLRFHRDLLGQLTAYTEHYKDILTLALSPLVVPGGEATKNEPRLLEQIHKLINAARLCRHSYLLVMGGGAVLDMAGYAAATAHRGIRLIRIPTTVVSQSDGGVGVKNGVNAFGKKNFLGTFMPPYAVLNDFDFLGTLSDRDWRAGIAEAVKVALIKDSGFFEFIRLHAQALVNRDIDAMQAIVYHSAKLHLEHIARSGDPFEQGSSRPLDFGHWVAHKLEQLTDFRLRHGEAVAIGIALDSTYSYLQGLLSRLEWQRILNTLAALGFILYLPELAEAAHQLEHPRCLFQGLTEFQEHLGGELTLMLLQNIGQGIEVHEVDLSAYRKAISTLREFAENTQMLAIS